MKRFAAFILSLMMVLPIFSAYPISLSAMSDEFIINDEIENVYVGKKEATDKIAYLNFTDVSSGHWAKEAIIRDGALDLVKGYGKTFRPDSAVTKAEAIAFILRVIGFERPAIELGATLGRDREELGLTSTWSLGYLNYAMQLGLITNEDYQNGIAEVEEGSEPDTNAFNRDASATREEVANWLYLALRNFDSNAFDRNSKLDAAMTFSDWQNISADKIIGVDNIAKNGIMNGSGGRFNPKSNITRAEITQVLANLSDFYYNLTGITRLTGTVGAVRDNQYSTTGTSNLWRNIYIRKSTGKVDVLQFNMENSNSAQAKNEDAVVYKDGRVTSLAALKDNDVIEYLVQGSNVLYVMVTSSSVEKVNTTHKGFLGAVNTSEYTVQIGDAFGKKFIFSLADYLLQEKDGVYSLYIDKQYHKVTALPYGSEFELTLTNNIVTEIKFVGQYKLYDEIRGIVVENEPKFGYITIIDNNGNKVTKNYIESDLVVEKQEYYDVDDEIGYYNQMFPHFDYDPRGTKIDNIEAGDVVFIRLSDSDKSYATQISASTNYIMRYAKIINIHYAGDYSTVLVEYENKQQSWFDMANNIFITKDGKLISAKDIKVGDWARFLVNEAIIEPGYVIESIKEVAVEGDEHYISSIVKGNLTGVNQVQMELLVEGAQKMEKSGWTGYKDIQTFSLSGKNIEYYYNGGRISLDYALKYFKYSDTTVYIAMENNYAGEKVRKVTFRIGRDEMYTTDTVLSSSANGGFYIFGRDASISADGGTIVRRFGRLVSPDTIMPSDYLQVSVNSDGMAAVVDITNAPDISKIMITRGRLKTINEGKSFTVSSMYIMDDRGKWTYTPVNREYAIDNKTVFLGESGYVDKSAFLDYESNAMLENDNVFNIVHDGTRASHVVVSPYAKRAVRGEIYKVEDNNDGTATIYIKNSYYQQEKYARWVAVSTNKSNLVITVAKNTLIAKNNEIVQPNKLAIGDQIMVMTDTLPNKVVVDTNINGYIIITEK